MTRAMAALQIVLDSIVFSLQRAGGISVYWSQLVRRIMRDGLPAATIEADGATSNIFRQKLDLPRDRVVPNGRGRVAFARYLPPKVLLPGGCVFHSSYYRLPGTARCKVVQTVYDFTYERFRSGLPAWVHSTQKRRAALGADAIICISESTKRDLMTFVPGISEDRVRVIYLGIAEEFCRLPDIESARWNDNRVAGRPYVVFVGDRSSYKNFPVAVEAAARLSDYALVVVGGGPLNHWERSLLDDALEGRYLHFDGIDNELLNRIYGAARALIYPSSYEGFGIPVVEAMAAGCPVVALNASSIPEAAGTGGLLVDSADAGQIVERVLQLEQGSFRQAVIERGLSNARRFSWERCYRETLSVYEEICARA